MGKLSVEYNGVVSVAGEPDVLCGKKAREKYGEIMKQYRQRMTASAKASGIVEEETELTQILKDIFELEDISKGEAAEKSKRKLLQVSA